MIKLFQWRHRVHTVEVFDIRQCVLHDTSWSELESVVPRKESANYCCENFEKLTDFILEHLEEHESLAISSLKALVFAKKEELAVSLACIAGEFAHLVTDKETARKDLTWGCCPTG